MKRKITGLILIFLLFVTLSGCNRSTATPSPAPVQPTESPAATAEPMALTINGEGITISEYQAELTRLQKAQADLGTTSTAAEQHDRLIDDLTDQLLLAQAAAQNGFVVDDATLQARIDSLAGKMGGNEKLLAWESANGYTEDSFKVALKRSIAVAWQRDEIINSVPATADQVHARQILVQDEANANNYLLQLKNGVDFATLAYQVDPTTGGDLGWFPQGYLSQAEVEAAAFALDPGKYSEVIHSEIGYHIIYVIERDANHALSVEARRALQQKKLDEWLQASKEISAIEVLVQ